MSETLVRPYNTLRKAVLEKQQITCIYNGLYRECCPYALGQSRGIDRILVYQFGGESSKGLPIGGEWRCMDVAKIENIQVKAGQWFTGASHTRPQTCITNVDVEVMAD